MSRWPALILLAAVLLLACASPPPLPAVVAVPPAPLAVAADAPAAPEPEERLVDDPDPGPVPVLSSDPWWGRHDAPVTIVVYADFQCPFCTRFNVTLSEVRRRYGPERVRIVWKDLPLAFHPQAKPAAIVARMTFARFGNKAFWDLHDAFFADTQNLAAAIEAAAARLGLSPEDVDSLAKGPEGERFDAVVQAANAIGARGTPASFINGGFVGGAQSLEKLAEVIDAQLVKARELTDRGTPARRVYAELAKAQWTARPPTPPAKDDGVVWQVPIGKSPVRGKASALVTVVEFAEFQCPFCGRVAATLEQVRAKYGDDVRFVWKHNPMPFHARAVPAAALAIEARLQKGDAGFWRAHDLLFQGRCAGNTQHQSRAECEVTGGVWTVHQQHLDTPDLLSYAASLGLDARRVQGAIDNQAHVALVERDQDLADDLDAHGTPHFFINGRRLVGAQPIERFVALIDEELGKARALVQGGVRPAKVYEHIMAGAKGPLEPEKKTVAAPTRDNPSRGPQSAKVVVQMFGDFQCPFCARARDTVDALEKAFPGKIRIVWRHLPIAFHQNALPAAHAAAEAFRQRGQAGFWAMSEALFTSQSALDRASLDQIAAQQGLDVQRFAAALDTQAHQAVIDADMKAAADAGIKGTPAFVINGYFISGAQPLAKLKKVVRLALRGK